MGIWWFTRRAPSASNTQSSPLLGRQPSSSCTDYASVSEQQTKQEPYTEYWKDLEDGTSRPDEGSISVYAWENVGMLVHIAALGTIYTTVSGVIYSVLNNYLHMSATLVATAIALVNFPPSLRLFTGMLADAVPIYGNRRRPYMMLGWSMAFVSCLLMAVLPLGDPYYSDLKIAKLDPSKLTQAQLNTIDFSAPNRGIKLIILMMFANLGTVFATSGFNGVLIEISQQEPASIRGKAMGETMVVYYFFSIISAFFTGLGLNSSDYGGTFSWTITFNGVMGICATMAFIAVPFSWFCIRETPVASLPPRTKSVFRYVFDLLQLRFVYRYVAFRFFFNAFAYFSVTASSAIQSTWVKVEPLNNEIATMLAALVTMVGRTALNNSNFNGTGDTSSSLPSVTLCSSMSFQQCSRHGTW